MKYFNFTSYVTCKSLCIHFLWWLHPLGHQQSSGANGQHFRFPRRTPSEEESCLIHSQVLPLNWFRMGDLTSQWLGHAEAAHVQYLKQDRFINFHDLMTC